MNNQQILQAMALDLKRAAIGYHSGSRSMADVFMREVMKNKSLLDYSTLSKSIKKILGNFRFLENEEDSKTKAEYVLLYSTLLLSYSTRDK